MLINLFRTSRMNPWHLLSLMLHLVALGLWLGGIVFFLIVFAPSVNELRSGVGIRVLNQGRIYFEALSWPAIAVLLITGIANLMLRYQITAGSLSRLYVIVLSIKLFLFLAMLVHHCLQAFKYGPKIASLTAQAPAEIGAWPEPLRSMWQRWFLLLKLNAGLAPIVTLLGLALIQS